MVITSVVAIFFLKFETKSQHVIIIIIRKQKPLTKKKNEIKSYKSEN